MIWPPPDDRTFYDPDIDWPYDNTEWEDHGQEEYERIRNLEDEWSDN